jgi:hypothetical protein
MSHKVERNLHLPQSGEFTFAYTENAATGTGKKDERNLQNPTVLLVSHKLKEVNLIFLTCTNPTRSITVIWIMDQ